MKKKRFSTEQIVTVLKQAEMGMAVADLIRQIGISLRGPSVRSRRSTAGRSSMAGFSLNRSGS